MEGTDLQGIDRVARSLVGYYRTGPGDEHLPHCHPDISQFYCVIQGAREFTVSKEIIEGKPGSAIYITAGVWQGFKNTSTEILIIFDGFSDFKKI